MLEPVKTIDWRTLLAVSSGLDSRQLISLSFQQLAENAGKIGELNISPDLLATLLAKEERTPTGKRGPKS
jgi:hypothetical protein